jgi:hypothetical protein
MTKTLNQIFFFLHQNQNIFFSNIGNQNIFLEKKHNPPPIQFKWSFPKRNVPIKTTPKKDGCPWITSDIKRLIRKRVRWYKRSSKSGHSGDNKKFKDLKCTTQKEISRAY